MEFVQEPVATFHDLGDAAPAAPTESAAVVVPMTGRDRTRPAADRVFSTLEHVQPDRVVVALRASPDQVSPTSEWLRGFDFSLETVWCDGPALTELLAEAGLAERGGKGRDVWLAMGIAAAESPYVAVHDVDASSYAPVHVPRLLFPLDNGFQFSKGYYARVEDGKLYGRLYRLLYAPLLRTLTTTHDNPVLPFLGAFRYALAGEFATTADLVRQLRPAHGWGLEVSILGDAYREAGTDGSAQVDLGVHKHDHRSVSGAHGLADMAGEVAATILAVVESQGVTPDYETLAERYRSVAKAYVHRYALDAAFNGLEYDLDHEHDQVRAYADAVRPAPDPRYPSWDAVSVEPADVLSAVRSDLRTTVDD